MRFLVGCTFCVAVATLGAAAQTPPTIERPENVLPAEPNTSKPKVTYFLIDASGSMESRIETAEREVELRIAAMDPSARVSRTYFRATDRKSCWEKIDISETSTAAESKREKITFQNDDYTPLGGALQAAILAAGDGPADIFLVTDDEQSPYCGIDVCDVAGTLPILGVNVRTISVMPDRAIHDRVGGCIEGAQGRPLPAATTNVPIPQLAPQQSAQDLWELFCKSTIIFIEKWFWLLGFALIAGSSALFGRRDARHAVHIRSKTQDVRSHRDLIRQGQKDDKGDLQKIIDDTRKYIENAKKPARVLWAMFAAGAISLVLLAWLPDHVGSLHIGGAKEAAGDILNSNFATAFAGTWLALVYFASSQSQRRSEAENDFSVVSDEAQAIENAQRTETFKQYEAAYDAVAGVSFEPPQIGPVLRASNIDETAEEDASPPDAADFRLVAAEAVRLALRSKLSVNETQDKVLDETNRLRRLLRPPLLRAFNFATFIENALRDHSIATHTEAWQGIANAYPIDGRAALGLAKALAVALAADGAATGAPT